MIRLQPSYRVKHMRFHNYVPEWNIARGDPHNEKTLLGADLGVHILGGGVALFDIRIVENKTFFFNAKFE